MSDKQKQWKKRAWFKLRLSGFTLTEYLACTFITSRERSIVRQIVNLIQILLVEFEESSRELGFKVAEHRCHYCNRPASKAITLLDRDKTEYFCNKCIKHLSETMKDNIKMEY